MHGDTFLFHGLVPSLHGDLLTPFQAAARVSVFKQRRMVGNLRLALKLSRAPKCTFGALVSLSTSLIFATIRRF